MINETSHTGVMKGQRMFGEEQQKAASAYVKFLEFIDKGMIIEVPHPSCGKGHTLCLDIQVCGIKNEIHFEVTARVMEIENLDEGRDRIKVTLLTYDELFWNAFKSVFQNRQQEVTEFFFAAKGTEKP